MSREASLLARRVLRLSVLLIICRSRVRAPPAPPAVSLGFAADPWTGSPKRLAPARLPGKPRPSCSAAGTNQRRRNAAAPSTLEWWQELQANIEAADRALARQHQATIDAGQLWPPSPPPGAATGSWARTQPGNSMPERPEILKPEPDRYGERVTLLDELQARADDAAGRVQAQRAELDASSKHTARMERNTKAEPQANRQAEAPTRSRWSCRRSGRARVAGVERLRDRL